MTHRVRARSRLVAPLSLVATVLAGAALHRPAPAVAAAPAAPPVTFTKDIAPILQRSCQGCHRPESVAPMSLITYEEVRPYARSIKERVLIRDRQRAMPPWYIEKNVGIQHYKNDFSLSDEQIARIVQWADSGAQRGSPADLPLPSPVPDDADWVIGKPDLVVATPAVHMKAVNPDWWGGVGYAPTGLTEDRYVAAMEVKEVNDARSKSGRATVGGLFIFHHAIMGVADAEGRPQGIAGWPVHEVGRNADVFDPDAGKLLRAGSQVGFPNVHMHANGKDTTAHLEIGFKFHPVGYQPKIQERTISIGTGDIDVRPMQADQKVETFLTLQQPTKITVFEPHMHAAGVRMCLEAFWNSKMETLSCAGYDHNWVRAYQYTDEAAPLLPRGTILRVTGTFDNTPANRNVVDPRNWSGLGHRSIDNMAILILQTVSLSDEQFQQEVAARRERLGLAEGQTAIGCPLCAFGKLPGSRGSSSTSGGQ